MPHPQSFPIWMNLALFALAGAFIWVTGTRLSRYADLIAGRTGLGQAFVGIVLLAAATSLPELASVTTATFIGNAPLAVNNLLGGIVLQTAILAVADRVSGGDALTHFIARSVMLLEGLLVVILLAITLTAMAVGDTQSPIGSGYWTPIVFVAYFVSIYLVKQYRRDERWQPTEDSAGASGNAAMEQRREEYKDWSNGRVYLAFAGGAVVILLAGTTVARTGDALASQTGLGGGFLGLTLVALATSLPELSTTISAARMGAYSMAVSNIFGSALILPALLFPADLIYRSGPVLAQADASTLLAAGAGIVVTTVYLVGLIERRDRTVAGLGIDSAVVVVLYLVTLVAQYLMR